MSNIYHRKWIDYTKETPLCFPLGMKSISEFISLRIFQDTKIPQTPKQQFMKKFLSWEFGVFLGYAPGEMFVSHDLCQERMELQLGGYGVGYRGMCRFRCRWNKFGRGGWIWVSNVRCRIFLQLLSLRNLCMAVKSITALMYWSNSWFYIIWYVFQDGYISYSIYILFLYNMMQDIKFLNLN